MKTNIITLLFLLFVLNVHAQDSVWKHFNIKQYCSFSLPFAEQTDTVINKSGSDLSINMFSYNTDSLLIQIVSTVAASGSSFSKAERTEGEHGFKRGIRKQTEGKGLFVAFKDSVLAGMPCIVSHITGKETLIDNYAVLHDSRLYVFTIVFNYMNKADVAQTTEKFLASIHFAQEEKPDSSYEMGYKAGRVIGYLIIPAIIGLILFFILRKKNK